MLYIYLVASNPGSKMKLEPLMGSHREPAATSPLPPESKPEDMEYASSLLPHTRIYAAVRASKHASKVQPSSSF